MICGADACTDVSQFGEAKVKWLKAFLNSPQGFPSHDTFGTVFAAIEPDALKRIFLSWVNPLAGWSKGRFIAMDRKTLRRSVDPPTNKAAIHMVSPGH